MPEIFSDTTEINFDKRTDKTVCLGRLEGSVKGKITNPNFLNRFVGYRICVSPSEISRIEVTLDFSFRYCLLAGA